MHTQTMLVDLFRKREQKETEYRETAIFMGQEEPTKET